MARKTNPRQQQRRGPNKQRQSRAGGPTGADPRGLTTMRVNCPVDPPPNAQELTVSHRVQFDVDASAGAGATVTLAQCLSLVPGGAAVWDKARLLRVAVWGPAAAGMTVSLTMATAQGDLASWKDYATQGAKRSGIAVVPDFLTRITWMQTVTGPGPSNTPLFNVQGGGTGVNHLTVQVTLQLRTLPALQEPTMALLRDALAQSPRSERYAWATNIVGTYTDSAGLQRAVNLVSG
jgi:hypothetical protein